MRVDTPDNTKALWYYHQGVKFGSQECASVLERAFARGPLYSAAPNIDPAREKRYQEISNILSLDLDARFPNLDKVVPLPPAELPYWDGSRKTLIDAAKGVIPLPPPPKPHPGTTKTGRAHVPEGHTLGEPRYFIQGHIAKADADGFWQPRLIADLALGSAAFVNQIDPQRYLRGEALESYAELNTSNMRTRWRALSRPQLDGLMWQYLGEAIPIAPRGQPLLTRLGLARAVEPVEALRCNGLRPCPKTGIWAASVVAEHPLARSFNRWERQAYVQEGQSFPDPKTSHLEIDAQDVRWTFMGEANRVSTNGLVQVTLG